MKTIVMVSGHACIRVQKMALPLIEKGHNVHLIASKMPPFYEQYKTFSMYKDIGQLIELIKLYADKADVFHAHNEPSWFVTIIKEHCDVPVVLDVHDSYLARMTPEEEDELRAKGENTHRVTTEERNNFQLADGLVFPSEPFADLIIGEFGLQQDRLILPSYVPRRLYRYDCREWLGGLVYEGRVDLKEEIEKDHRSYGFRYCDYEELANKAHKLGIDFHLRTIRTDKAFKDKYDDIAFIHEPAMIQDLIKRLTKHDWGLVGNVFKTPDWDVAFPNKLFEYIAACVPVVAINARECGRFIEEYGIGIEVESLEELAERWSEHTECRKRLIKIRQQFTMDNNIHKLEELYDTVKGGGEARNADRRGLLGQHSKKTVNG